MPARRLRACPDCDWLVELPALHSGEQADCPRCGHTLVRRFAQPAQRGLALALSALVALVLALSFPFVSFELAGQGSRIELTQTASRLMDFRQPLVGLAVALSIFILPALYLLQVIWLHAGLLRGQRLPLSRTLARLLMRFTPWMMADVFVVGALVSLIKIAGSAEIGLGIGFWAFCAFALLLLAVTRSLDADWLWLGLAGEPPAPERARTGAPAALQGLSGCPRCALVNRLDHQGQGLCRRCGESLHARAPFSLQRTWALLAAAAVMYLPANLYPIMSTSTLGRDTPSTILGGVVELWAMGSWPIALIIFVASVVVPIGKLVVLGWLCLAVGNAGIAGRHPLRLYRLTEYIGRWSMIDVFVVAILVALIHAGAVLSIRPGPAALAFAGVVILTMLAAISFDPRLLWDSARSNAAGPRLGEAP